MCEHGRSCRKLGNRLNPKLFDKTEPQTAGRSCNSKADVMMLPLQVCFCQKQDTPCLFGRRTLQLAQPQTTAWTHRYPCKQRRRTISITLITVQHRTHSRNDIIVACFIAWLCPEYLTRILPDFRGRRRRRSSCCHVTAVAASAMLLLLT
jgi:hypothetical protein